MIEAETALLDDPIWSALTTGNRALAQGGALAKRFAPDVSPFGAVAEPTGPAFAALAALTPPEGRVALVGLEPIAAPAGLSVDMQAAIVQMVMQRAAAPPSDSPVPVELGAADVAAMLDLTGRTRPGPFGPRTIAFGRYIGVKSEGALAAMAGERMRIGRFVEISGVCVDPAFRGRGYADLLMRRLAVDLQARGLTPFLHVFADNIGAIALYEKLGFATRRQLFVTSFKPY